MSVKTESYFGEIKKFDTLQKALEFSEDQLLKLDKDEWETELTKANNCVQKITFDLPTKERVILEREGGKWVMKETFRLID